VSTLIRLDRYLFPALTPFAPVSYDSEKRGSILSLSSLLRQCEVPNFGQTCLHGPKSKIESCIAYPNETDACLDLEQTDSYEAD